MNIEHLSFPDQGWGYMPATEEMFNVFRSCQERYHPKRVLEIGFHLGHSTTYQLEIYNDAELVSVSPYNDDILSSDKIDPADRHRMAIKLAELYPTRWRWIPGKSHIVKDELKPFKFDFALVDGSHKYDPALCDMNICLDLGIKRFLIDNFDHPAVRRATKDTGKLSTVEIFNYDHTFKGKTKTNQIALVEVD